MRLKYFLLSLILPLSMLYVPQTANANSCDDVKFIFARGSGSDLNAEDYQAFKNSLDSLLSEKSLSYSFYELGSEAHSGYQYTAAAVGLASLGELFTALGALVSAGENYSFGESVDNGVAELKAYIDETDKTCPNTKFVLGGYSQGAIVVSKSLSSLDPNKIIYASTFGDPKLYLPEGQGKDPDACHGKNLSNYRIYVPDCRTYNGILGGLNPYQTSAYIDKIGVWCSYQDIMCSQYINLLDPITVHLNYVEDNLYEHAAKIIFNKLADHFPAQLPEKVDSYISNRDTAILIDSTGSMTSLIEKYKKEALRLAQETFDAGGRVALYEYRDLKDPFEPVQLCSFETCNYKIFENEINSITTNGGGDTAESALSASLHIMNTEKWQVSAVKSIVLLTDADYLSPDVDGVTLFELQQRSLEIDPVNIYAITPESIAPRYQELATSTGGQVFGATDQLHMSTSYILSRPNVAFPVFEYIGNIGQEFNFSVASESQVTQYEWDLDCDGIFEYLTNTASIQKIYDTAISGYIQVRVTDQAGQTNTSSAKLTVNQPTSTAEISDASYQKNADSSATVTFNRHAEIVLLAVNDVIMGALTTTQVTVTDLDFSQDNQISLIPISDSGYRGNTVNLTIPANQTTTNLVENTLKKLDSAFIKAPETGFIDQNLDANDRQTHTYKQSN